MASAQEPGVCRLTVKKPSGAEIELLKMRSEELGPGGSPDHVVSANQDKWRFINVGGPIINHGDELRLYFKPDGADTIDVSDCVMTIPFRRAGGGTDIVTDADMTMDDVAIAAGAETLLATYTFVGGPRKFGGQHIGLFIEDDT